MITMLGDHTMHGCDLGRTGERRVVFMARAALPRSLAVAATAIDEYREKLSHTHTHTGLAMGE